MEEILKFENRHNLYKFLIDDYGFNVIEEKYYPDQFGNFYIDLESECFLLRYYNDRNVLSVDVSSHNEEEWYALSFIKDLVYNPEAINADETDKSNVTRIEELNRFIHKDFKKICELFSKTNYPDTKKRLDEGLRKQFYLKHPSAKP